ncbi:hypothetical protein K469DRAFT_597856 [Zopfia rhizophila CBS 207.26]|uniref:Uncharacterized protein n=1 Tax=Zopfia rhizophila CBS 207.26 TaxID=1314779 RepID=A0A6A6DHG6_9PEZI|nr:hypothetical protein K469DRAFT_597856 [Zopfia rhizophila CBS 207.26]
MHEKSNNLGHNRWIIPPSIPDLWAWIFGKLRKRLRPVLRSGFRRIEWKCDCGKELYADFSNDDPIAIDKLESALQQTFSPLGSNGFLNPVNGNAPDVPPGNTRGELGPSPVAPQSDSRQASTGGLPIAANSILNVQHDQVSPQRKYFAICISAGGIYKVLTEIDVSSLKSDAGLFLAVKEIYQNSRKSKIRWRMFLEPVNIEFVQFSLWNTRQGYVSICDRPTCVPPKDDFQYAFSPRPLQPLPPVPPEIFMHYLEHGEHDMNPNMYVWTPRLPKRKDSRIIDCPLPTFGWGIYIREGPNRVFVFWMIMVTVVCSVILCILWTSVKGDIQGGSGLGTLILALPSVIMAAFMFKFSDTY